MTFITLLLSTLLYFTPAESPDGFQPLVFSDQQATRFAGHSFRLEGPDQPDKPTAWQGPLTIATGEKSCDANLSLVTAVYAAQEFPYVIAVTLQRLQHPRTFLDHRHLRHPVDDL